MEIVYDYDCPPGSPVEARHLIDTDDPRAMGLIARLREGTQTIEGTGWDVISKHPGYEGKTRLEVVLAEIQRMGVET